jgi:xanthine dehydrogenase YagR molybdenum-binding subunit
MKYIGKEMSRVDGVAKVTGKATYVAGFPVKNAVYGYTDAKFDFEKVKNQA